MCLTFYVLGEVFYIVIITLKILPSLLILCSWESIVHCVEGIPPHVDTHSSFHDTIVIVSLQSQASI